MEQTEQKLIEKKANRSITIGTILGYISLALSILSGLFFTPWIKQAIGKSNYGLYTLSTSLVNLFLIDFGLSATANTFLAKYRAKNDQESISNFLAVIYRLYLIVDLFVLVGFIIVYFLIDKIYVGLTPEEIKSFKYIFIIAAGFSVISFPCTIFPGIIQSYEKFVALKIIDIIHRVIFIGTSTLAILFHWDLIGLVIANFGSALLCHLIRYIFIKFKIKTKANFHFKAQKDFIKKVLFYSGWAAVNSITSRLVFNVMPSILGVVADSENIATFGYISQLEGYIYMFGNVIGGFFLPKIARLKEEQDRTKIEDLATKIGKIQLYLIGLIFSGFVCCGYDFINIWLKHDPSTTIVYFGTIMIIAYQLIYIPQIVYYNEMFISNYVKSLAIGSLIKAGINCCLAFLFGYFYGALGAAISVAISRVFELAYVNFSYKRHLKANLGNFFKKVYLKSLPSFLIAIISSLPISLFLKTDEKIRFLVSGVVVILTFTVFYWLFALNKNEKNELLSKIKRRKK